MQAPILRKWNECHIIRNETVTHAVVAGALLKVFLCNFCYCVNIFLIEKSDCMEIAIDGFMIFNFKFLW